jgi:hypothetical protein
LGCVYSYRSGTVRTYPLFFARLQFRRCPGAEVMLARLPLVVFSAGTASIRRITPSCSGHYPSGRKKISRSIAQDFRILAKGLTHVLFWLMRIAELAEPSRSPI